MDSATLFSGFVGAMLGAFAVVGVNFANIVSARHVARQSRAHELYNRFLMRSFEYPQFGTFEAFERTFPAAAKDCFDLFRFSSLEGEKYQWSVSMMLAMADEILAIKDDHKGWLAMIKMEIRHHEPFLKKAWNDLRPLYSEDLQALVESAI